MTTEIRLLPTHDFGLKKIFDWPGIFFFDWVTRTRGRVQLVIT
jgi:hypothetical protein